MTAPAIVCGKRRSPKWEKCRKDHLRKFPACAACGSKRKLEVHHVRPYHLFPALELDPTNLITLCETDHLVLGHLHEWESFNPTCRRDVKRYRVAIKKRPKSGES